MCERVCMCDQSCVQGRKDACPFYETKTTFQISGGGGGEERGQ